MQSFLKAYSTPFKRSKMNLFTKIVKGSQPLAVFTKSSILDVWKDSEYASAFWVFQLESLRKRTDFKYSRLMVIRTSTENNNLLRKTEISNNGKSTLKWPISNYYQFFTELGYKIDADLWNKMLRKTFPCKNNKILNFFDVIVYFRLLFCF